MGDWEWRILGKSGAGLLAEFLTDLEKGNAEEGGELGDPPVETHGDGEGEEEAQDGFGRGGGLGGVGEAQDVAAEGDFD